MNTNPNGAKSAEDKLWLKQQLSKGVYELCDQGVFDQTLVEAHPTWVLPHSLLVGKIRNMGAESSTRWFICGDCETLHIPAEVANTSQEAVRHFALLWQTKLGKEPQPESATQQAAIQKAESLYELSQQNGLWVHGN